MRKVLYASAAFLLLTGAAMAQSGGSTSGGAGSSQGGSQGSGNAGGGGNAPGNLPNARSGAVPYGNTSATTVMPATPDTTSNLGGAAAPNSTGAKNGGVSGGTGSKPGGAGVK